MDMNDEIKEQGQSKDNVSQNEEMLNSTQQSAAGNSLLSYCQACGNKVSKHALACPACGHPAYTAAPQNQAVTQKVTVTDVDMHFTSMIYFMIKWAIAAIPAALVLLAIGAFIMGFLAAIGASTPKLPTI